MTSSSEYETDISDGDDDANTVIMESSRDKFKGKEEGCSVDNSGNTATNTKDSRGDHGTLWKSGALFTLRIGTEDKELNTEEWIYFLISTMKEVLENPKSLCEKHFFTMLVAPLRNHLAEPEVIERIARLLALPFTLDKSVLDNEPSLLMQLQTIYLDTKVLPNLLYACKLIVRRRRVGKGSMTLDEIPAILTAEDLEGLGKCLRLITFLVYMDEDYVTQVYDSLSVLQAFQIFQLFLKLDFMRPDLTADTIAMLCHIMRIFPTNKSILEEIFLDGHESSPDSCSCSELLRMLNHFNYLIQSRAIRLYTYLCLNSEKIKTDFVTIRRPQIWKILRRATISPHEEVRFAAEFSLQVLNHRSSSIHSNSSGKSLPVLGSGSANASGVAVAASSSSTKSANTDKEAQSGIQLRSSFKEDSQPILKNSASTSLEKDVRKKQATISKSKDAGHTSNYASR